MLEVRRKRGQGALLGTVLRLALLLAAHALESINGGRGDSPLTDKQHVALPLPPRSTGTVPAAFSKGRPAGSRAGRPRALGRGREVSTPPARKPWASRLGSRKTSAVAIGAGVILPLVALLERARASPFDPHPLPILLGLAFFNGWYIRVTDHENRLAFALILGSFKHKGADAYSEHYVALLYADKNGNIATAHAFPDPDTVTIKMDSDGYTGAPANFTWRAEKIGELRIEDSRGRMEFRLPGCSVAAAFRDRVPWDERRPDAAGPEGWLGKTMLLPCRYYVHSLGSRTTYRIRVSNRRRAETGPPVQGPQPQQPQQVQEQAQQQQRTALDGVVTGRGFAHMESNYGNHFPAGWIWVQAVSQLRDVKLVMVGGKFEIGPMAPTTWVIGYRSPRFNWDFRTTDLDTVEAEVKYSERTLYLTATSRCGRHKLEVEVCAPEWSFGSPIYVPTPTGFSNNPGCRESFTAKAFIRAYETSSPRMKVTEEHEIDLAALEFGGDMQRL